MWLSWSQGWGFCFDIRHKCSWVRGFPKENLGTNEKGRWMLGRRKTVGKTHCVLSAHRNVSRVALNGVLPRLGLDRVENKPRAW